MFQGDTRNLLHHHQWLILLLRKSHMTNKRRRWNYNSRAWHNQRIWYQEHIYWRRTICRSLWWLNCVHSILSLPFFKILFLINIYFSYLHIVVLLFYKLSVSILICLIPFPQYHVLLYHDWWIALITTKEIWSFINDYCHKKCIILWLKLWWPLLAKLLIFRQCFLCDYEKQYNLRSNGI